MLPGKARVDLYSQDEPGSQAPTRQWWPCWDLSTAYAVSFSQLGVLSSGKRAVTANMYRLLCARCCQKAIALLIATLGDRCR